MKTKLALLIGVGVAIGYVVGTASGRQRYAQLKSQAKRAVTHPKVQETASEVKDKVAETASKVTEAAGEKVHGSDAVPPQASGASTPTGSRLP